MTLWLMRSTTFYIEIVQKVSNSLGFKHFFHMHPTFPNKKWVWSNTSKVLDEIAVNKDTVLDIVGELHAMPNIISTIPNYKYFVLEGDSKTYNIIQAIKYEHGEDLS